MNGTVKGLLDNFFCRDTVLDAWLWASLQYRESSGVCTVIFSSAAAVGEGCVDLQETGSI